MPSAKPSWPSTWASSASSPKPAPVSTASPPPPSAPCWASGASFTWAPQTSNASPSTSSGMRLLEAEVIPVESGTRTLKDAINEAIRDWVTNVETTHYLIGSVVGPHPYPMLVRDFQSIIGREARRQILAAEERLPGYVVACVGGGSNAIGTFYEFLNDESVQLIGVEAGGEGVDTGRHSATLSAGRPGVLHGSMSYLLQDPKRPGSGHPQHLRRPGLPRRRTGTQLPQGQRARPIHRRHRRPGPGWVPPPVPHRRNHPRPGIGPRHHPRLQPGPPTRPRTNNPGLPKRPRRQRRPHRSPNRRHKPVTPGPSWQRQCN